ncbi:uncharacterized protein LOC114252691 [Bombyx mandarina]|uniref:Uncharacterized protein LOC114252691 n=1 Tax=Bombyx mandarina TaxID=7092 RepID=A0A6J2KQ39_BOMMA|nr:uncharacterized protein LOC114252691 [Bombyx mandarina]
MRSSGLVLFACAGLLFSGGAILGGSAAWSLFRMSYYFWTSDLGVELSSSVLFIAGALLCLPTCWLSTLVPYYPKSISLLTTLMSLLMASMFMISLGISSITGLSRVLREPAALNASMAQAMMLDAIDPAVRSSFAAMQLELKCCGVNSNLDWYKHRSSYPPACCGRASNEKRGERCDFPLYPTGCLRPALIQLRNYVNSLSALASAMIVCMAVTLFTAAYTLVTGVVERGETRVFKPPQPMFASFTAPSVIPIATHQM